MQINWHHLFSDAAFERLDKLIRASFRRGSYPSDIIIAQIYSPESREAVRQECEPILEAVAEEFSFNYDPKLDRDDNFRKFVPKINRCMQAICPATESLLHGKLEYYWLLLPKANLLEFMRSVIAFEGSTGGSYPFLKNFLLGWDFDRTIQLVKSILQTLRRTANLSDDLDEDTKAFLHEVSAVDAYDCCGINLDENLDDLQAGVWATDAGVWTRNPYIVLRSARQYLVTNTTQLNVTTTAVSMYDYLVVFGIHEKIDQKIKDIFGDDVQKLLEIKVDTLTIPSPAKNKMREAKEELQRGLKDGKTASQVLRQKKRENDRYSAIVNKRILEPGLWEDL